MARTESEDFRPIEARTLKSVCDTLRPYYEGRKTLDLFAGSGRLGLSALENGAMEATFVELGKGPARELKAKIPKGSKLVPGEALEFLKKTHETYDLVFADPPYRIWDQALSDRLLRAVRRVLRPDGIFLVRRPKRVITSLPEAFLKDLQLRLWKESRQGESILWYLVHEVEKESEEANSVEPKESERNDEH